MCHHPFDSLESCGRPGYSHCKSCRTYIECPHPFRCLLVSDDGSVTCVACTSRLHTALPKVPQPWMASTMVH